MAIRTYDILLDSYNSTIPEPIVGRQGDKNGAVTLHVTITDRGTAVDLTDQTVNLIAETAKGTAVVADNGGVTLTDAVNGKFDYAIPNALWSEPGKITKAYFSLNDSNGQQTTYDLFFIVKIAADMTKESAKDWVSNLNEIIDQYNQWVNNAHSSWEDFVNQNKEIIESIDPGGTLLTEVIAARNGKSNLKTRLDDEHAQVTEQLAEIAINVSAYGIVGDGQTIVTDDLNNLIFANRGHKIYIPDGIYIIDDSIFLYDDTPVELSSNAVLKFAAGTVSVRDKPNDYEGKHMIKAHKTLGTKNVEMYGGTIDGNAETQAKDAHRGIFLEGVDGLSIHDIKIKNISGWGIAHINCTNFHFYNIEFDQPSEELHGYNGDGITGMSSNGLIENISGYVSDDLVALQAGNTIFSPQSNANNVTINGLYPKKKDGRDEYAYRALGLYAYDGFELDNIVINNVRGVSEHEILISTPYYTQDSVKGKFGTIKLSDVDMKFKGSELMAFKILNVNVETLILDTLIFKDLDQPQISALKIENATVNRIVLDKFYCNKVIGDQPFIDDGGEVKRIELLNSYFNNDDIPKSGYIYAKNSNTTTVTEIIARNLSGNAGALMRGIKDSDKIRVVNSDFITQEVFVTNPINGDMILTNQGMKVYKQNRFSALGDGYNILSITSESYTLRDLCSTILVSGSLTKVEITLHSDIEKFNWEFKLSVPEKCIVTFKNGSGQNIFTSSVFDNGVYSIVRFGTSWLMSKISNSRFLTT